MPFQAILYVVYESDLRNGFKFGIKGEVGSNVEGSAAGGGSTTNMTQMMD